MKRTRTRNPQEGPSVDYEPLARNSTELPMRRVRSPQVPTIEAQVQENDTLQAIALRFNCQVSELKRLNKIERDNEIFARSVIRVPITPHTVLLETIPGVHKSGTSSPTRAKVVPENLGGRDLDEKLIIASVSHSERAPTDSIQNIILNTKISSNDYRDDDLAFDPLGIEERDLGQPLLSGEIDDAIPQPRIIPIRHRMDMSCNGADCDISWVCLFIFILVLCFAIPIIYIIFKTEPEHEHHVERLLHENHSKL
ncbi:lysM and putative peptidoglycan-binding domain-containing protein 3 [Lutzomyia longipalpis]|uniref:Putative peptidoglycan-binding protein n=1 Tax=Lutzomyia longipalpis TaxID=7200 RepID=A0A7G3AUE2_LUTLO|nr:lysM and putative peptidoglycan-binding domain-containing protein 3 [Lutzomyia longipalpis]